MITFRPETIKRFVEKVVEITGHNREYVRQKVQEALSKFRYYRSAGMLLRNVWGGGVAELDKYHVINVHYEARTIYPANVQVPVKALALYRVVPIYSDRPEPIDYELELLHEEIEYC